MLAALPLVDLADTLLVLTADHSHVMTLGGLATPRGNPILGMIIIYNFTICVPLFYCVSELRGCVNVTHVLPCWVRSSQSSEGKAKREISMDRLS
jgi:hypothetical protein